MECCLVSSRCTQSHEICIKNRKKKIICSPAGVIDVNFSASSCVGDALLLLAVLCGVNGGNELPCESMLARTVVGAVVVTRVPQKLKSNLLPDKRASRSRRHFSLSMCTWGTWAKEKKTKNGNVKNMRKCIYYYFIERNILIQLERRRASLKWIQLPTEAKSHAVHKS